MASLALFCAISAAPSALCISVREVSVSFDIVLAGEASGAFAPRCLKARRCLRFMAACRAILACVDLSVSQGLADVRIVARNRRLDSTINVRFCRAKRAFVLIRECLFLTRNGHHAKHFA
jgi:hypothetical protein